MENKTEATPESISSGIEPSEEMIRDYMRIYKINWYAARAKARDVAYGGSPPSGFTDWGTYWKCY